jgi:tyrosyl-tRNA synthetase
VTEFLFGEGDKLETLKKLSKTEIEAVWHEVGSLKVAGELSVIDALVDSWLEASKWDAKKSITAGAIYLNEEKVSDIGTLVDTSKAINGCLLLRKGKKSYKILSTK